MSEHSRIVRFACSQDLISPCRNGYSMSGTFTRRATNSMIRNGLYHITVEMLDGVQGGNQGVMVVRDGTLRDGDSFFLPTAPTPRRTANGKARSPTRSTRRPMASGPVWERKVVTIGFTGTYTDDTAESDGIALAGKQSIRFKSKL